MDNNSPDKRIDYGLVRAFAHAVEWAVKKYECDPVSFVIECFGSEGFSNFADDCSLYTQSSSCIAGRILEELKNKGKAITKISGTRESRLIDEEDGFWLGYLVMYWVLLEDVTGKDLLKYDWELVRDAYDTLHTTTPKYAIDFIKREYKVA